MLTNYHTHHSICDGKEEAEAYVRAAAWKGFTALGFSSHAPLPFANHWTMQAENYPAYCEEIRSLAKLYAGRMEIYLGLEVDFISGEFGRPPYALDGFSAESSLSWPTEGLDYYIGAVHVFPVPQGEPGKPDYKPGPAGNPESCPPPRPAYREIDHTIEEFEAIRDQNYGGDIQAFVTGYYAYVRELCERFRPPVLAHLDLIKKNNADGKYFNEEDPWYRDLLRGLVPVIAQSGCIVEVNTGGLARGKTSTVYPSPWILSLLREAGVPIMLNADAHRPDTIDSHFDMARDLIRKAGYKSLRVLRAGGWEETGI